MLKTMTEKYTIRFFLDYSGPSTIGSTLHGKHSLVLDTSQISFTLTRDVEDRTLLTKETATGNSMSNPPSNGITYSSSTPSMESQHATATTAAATPGSRITFWSHDSVTHQANGRGIHDSSETLQTDSLRTVQEAISYSTAMDRGQPGVSSFQIQPSLPSLSSTITPSNAGLEIIGASFYKSS